MLLSLTVFMNIVSELMPITSDAVPLIGKQTPPGKHYTSHIMPPPTLLGGLSLCLTLHIDTRAGNEGPQSLQLMVKASTRALSMLKASTKY